MSNNKRMMKHLIQMWEAAQPPGKNKPPDELAVLRSEAHQLLRSFLLALKQTKVVEAEAHEAREGNEKVWIAHVLIEDVILRLCKFDDDDTRSWSFDQVGKKLRKRKATKNQVEGHEKLLKSYSKQIGHLVEQHRNKYIAHLTAKPSGKDQEPKPITAAIQQALGILDKFCGHKVALIEPDEKTDLRAEFEKLIGRSA